MLNQIKLIVQAKAPLVTIGKVKGVSLFLSVSDSLQRAQVHHFFSSDFDSAWIQLEHSYYNWIQTAQPETQWLRVDWTQQVRATHFSQLETWLKDVKRNYFRWGLVFGDQLQYAFTEQELNANAMLYGGVHIPHVVINQNNFASYARKKYGELKTEPQGSQPVWMLDNAGVFVETGATEPVLLYGKGRDAGRRQIERLTASHVEHVIKTSSEYLASQVQSSGHFYYGWHPCFDREIKFYNALRHCSTIYSMVEAWEVTQDDQLLQAIQRALDYALEHFVKTEIDAQGVKRAFVVEYTGKEIKLGANAVLILALSKYSELIDATKYAELLELLALGIEFMQNPTTGQFVHVLNYPDLSVKEVFRIIYYDGEAAFGLMRLYGLTKNPRWLGIVEKAFNYFIANEHWRAHDHWLSYCVNELTLYKEEEKYYRFGLQNVVGYLDFVAKRITTFPTLLELMMAAQRMVERLQVSETHKHLLKELDINEFYQALEKRAHYLLNGYFAPEIAMYFANPQRIVGSFFIRHHSFRVRIDDVEHYLSGYVAYLKYLTKIKQSFFLSKESVAEVTDGTWVVEPEKNWEATGICIYKPVFKTGHILVARSPGAANYLSETVVKGLVKKQASSILCTDPTPYMEQGVPVLKVPDLKASVLKLGFAAREGFSGNVLGVTGSAGKTTTVAMMAHALSQFGVTGHSQESANLPVGIAWNLINMPVNAMSWVVEMAIGQMVFNASLVKPKVALITNIAEAHLKHYENTRDIAERKSNIINEMNLNGTLVLFGEIKHKEIFLKKAKEKNVSLITYGELYDNDVQLLDSKEGVVKVRFFNENISFDIGLKNKHMILNALGVFSSLIALGFDWRKVLGVFSSFKVLKGRGEESLISYQNKQIVVCDDSYNANPCSMSVSIQSIKNIDSSRKRFLILGDMMELGDNEIIYHKNLKNEILEVKPKKLILCGSLMKYLWDDIKDDSDFCFIKKEWYLSSTEIIEKLDGWLEDKDYILLKASNSIGFGKLVDKLISLDSSCEI